MPLPPIRLAAWLTAAALCLASPALAQEGETEERGLTSPDVEESLAPQPTDQGTRSPDDLNEDDEPQLYQLLAQVRRAPPTLDAEKVFPRPNDFASEPAAEMTPEQYEDFSLFPDDYVE